MSDILEFVHRGRMVRALVHETTADASASLGTRRWSVIIDGDPARPGPEWREGEHSLIAEARIRRWLEGDGRDPAR